MPCFMYNQGCAAMELKDDTSTYFYQLVFDIFLYA